MRSKQKVEWYENSLNNCEASVRREMDTVCATQVRVLRWMIDNEKSRMQIARAKKEGKADYDYERYKINEKEAASIAIDRMIAHHEAAIRELKAKRDEL